MDFQPNDFVGSYRIVRKIGQGGMGAVYEVEHAELGVRFALKAFTLERGYREFLKKRFLAEAKILARLNHPRLVKGETTGTRPVMGTYWYLAPEIRRGGEAAEAAGAS